MNEILFYGGIVLAGIFMLASIILFFYNKVYSAIAFFTHRDRKTVVKAPAVKSSKKRKEKKKATVQEITPQLNNDDTEILRSTEDYTEILCDDVTEILE